MLAEYAGKAGFPVFGFSGQGDNPALRGESSPPEENMQLGGAEDGGLIYTESDLEVQNGNPGLKVVG